MSGAQFVCHSLAGLKTGPPHKRIADKHNPRPSVPNRFRITKTIAVMRERDRSASGVQRPPIISQRKPTQFPIVLKSQRLEGRGTFLAPVGQRLGQKEPQRQFAYCGAQTNRRSEERRVGKECRSRWSPY